MRAVWFSIGVSLMLSYGFVATRAVGQGEYCPDTCSSQGSSTQSGSSCATVAHQVLTQLDGSAEPECSTTCLSCKATVKITWDCANCSNGCVWVWGHQSYDGSGAGLPYQGGSGSGSGSVRQVVTTSCNGSTAEFGISVAGLLHAYNLACPCEL